MTPSFTDLSYFYEIADSLNFSHAARKLGISQPSLSKAISRLEKILDSSLFIRHSQGLTLTKSGQLLYNHVEELLNKWKQTESCLKQLNQEVGGKVIVGCHALLGNYLTNAVAQLVISHPLLEIQILNDCSDKITQGIIDGSLDIGFVVNPIMHPDLIMQKIKTIEITYWTNKETNFDPSIIIYDPQFSHTHFLIREFEKNHAIKRTFTVNNLAMVAELTINGTGIGILPSCLVQREYEAKLTRLADAPVFKVEMYLIYRNENKKMVARETVLTAIKNLIALTQA